MIANREALATTPARKLALDCVAAGIEAALPRRVVADQVAVDGDELTVAEATYDLAAHDEVLVLGGGKAAARVAAALEDVLGDRVDGGVVVTDDQVPTDRVDVVEAGHPVPDARGEVGARRVLAAAERSGEDTLVLAVVTGGGSALLPAPVDGLGLDGLQALTRDLLDAGGAIDEVNAVRKHVSELKGGRLARAAAPATVVSLLVSDVVGDDSAVVASGPTAADPTTYADALAVLDSYDLDAPAVRAHLRAGDAGEHPETPGADDPVFRDVQTHILANGWTAIDAARKVAVDAGYEPLVLSARVRGEARDAALTHVAVAEEIRATGNPVDPPAVVLSGGETTVTVRGDGTGGPNQEFALAAGIEFAAADGVGFAAVDEGSDRPPTDAALAAVDTDGRDGSTDAAGALVDGETVDDLAAARAALDRNDAFRYLHSRDALVRTGRTGTNVNDLRVLVVP